MNGRTIYSHQIVAGERNLSRGEEHALKVSYLLLQPKFITENRVVSPVSFRIIFSSKPECISANLKYILEIMYNVVSSHKMLDLFPNTETAIYMYCKSSSFPADLIFQASEMSFATFISTIISMISEA